jgi:hypothetical protein
MKAKRRTQTEVVSDWIYGQLTDLSLTKQKKAKDCNFAAKLIGKPAVMDVIDRVSDEQKQEGKHDVAYSMDEHMENQIELWIENVSTCDCCGSHMGCV